MTVHISVLTTLYNHEKFITETINSALQQNLMPNEIVVIDDASSDNSVAVARSIKNPIVRIYSEAANLGGPNTMKGLSLCTGNYVAILNSDDCWEPDKLRQQINYLEAHPECGAAFSHVTLIDENSRPWAAGSNRLQTVFNTHNRTRYDWLSDFFHHGNMLCASSAVIRRSCLSEVGGLDGRYVQMQDFDLWLRLTIAGYNLHVVEEPLTRYRASRVGLNMSSGNKKSRAIHAIEYARALRQFWKIASLAELKSALPAIEYAPDAGDALIIYYLAHYASLQKTPQHSLFASESMLHWGGNIEAMQLAHRCHGFTHKNYGDFLFENPLRYLVEHGLRGRLRSAADMVLPYAVQQKLKAFLPVFFRVK
jgi:GT2 family glycosyltransferase